MISHNIRKRSLLIQWIVENLVCFLYIQNKRDLMLQILISILSTEIEWKQCTPTINNDLYLSSCDWVFFFGKKGFYKSTFIKDLVEAKFLKRDFPKFIFLFFCQFTAAYFTSSFTWTTLISWKLNKTTSLVRNNFMWLSTRCLHKPV